MHPGARIVTVTVLLLVIGMGTGWAKCPKWGDTADPLAHSQGDNSTGAVIILFAATLSSVTSTVYAASAHAFGTSGCRRDARLERDTHQFIAASGLGLLHQMARGHGEHLQALSELLGCDASVQPIFGELMQARFGELVADGEPPPPLLLTRLKGALRADPRTAGRCSEA